MDEITVVSDPACGPVCEDGEIAFYDDVLAGAEHAKVHEFLVKGGWDWGWKSNQRTDTFNFWHRHFGGARDPLKHEVYECSNELPPLLFWMWHGLLDGALKGHRLVRCYANGMPYGCEGTLHTDAKDKGNFTAIYYPQPKWSPNWGGETVLFNREEDDVIACIYPKPNRLFVFPGMIPHVARSVSRTCPVLRITLMFKTEAPWLRKDTSSFSSARPVASSTRAGISTST